VTRAVVRFAAAAAALLLAACSSSSGPKPAELTDIPRAKPVRVLWSSDAGEGGSFTFFPALAGEAVYVAARDGTVRRLDASDGRERWRADAERQLSGGVGADARTVAVATEEGEVIAMDAENGKVRWRARASSEVLTPPTVGNGLVLVRTIDARIFAFEAEDGKRRWVYQRAPGSLILRVATGVSMSADTAFGGFSGGKLVAIALSNGAQRWETTVAVPKGANELERVTDVVGEPVLQGREVCAATYQGRVACFDADNGKQIWAREISSVTGVSVDARYAFVSDERGSVNAFDRSSGASVWKQDKLAYRELSLPRPVGDVVAVGDFEGEIHFLARESGNFVSRFSAGGGAVRAAPLLLSSGVLIQTQNGNLYALLP